LETWKTLAFDEDLIVRGGQHSDLALAVIVASEPGSKPGQWINEVACGTKRFPKMGGGTVPQASPSNHPAMRLGFSMK